MSKNAAQIISQLLSAISTEGTNNYTPSAENAWTYIPLIDVADSIVPPNVYGNDLDTFFKHSMSSGALADTSFYTAGQSILYQCV